MERGVMDFFDPNREGGFDAAEFFGEAGGPGPDPFGPEGEGVVGEFDPEGGFAPPGFEDEGVQQFQPPMAFDMGDGGQAMAWEDGMSQVVRDDGSFTVFWGDGKAMEREVTEDGGFIQTNPDGTVLQERR